jgi:hypothetical protein
MKSPEEIEAALQRLAPPALSPRVQSNVAAMLTDLSAKAAPVAVISRHRPRTWRFVSSAAALLIFGMGWSLRPPTLPVSTPPIAATAGVMDEMSPAPPVFVDRLLVTDGAMVENTLASEDGTVVKELKRRVHTHERYRDARRGYLITISETRDEKLYLPKNGF